jgi:aminoglycoside phosphotransferase family enzyme/predicted kinase
MSSTQQTGLATDFGRQLRSASFPHSVRSPQLIETHISWLVLTGEFAYKIKRPVRFDFLDYSTLELRRQQCQRELEIGRRYAPEIYLEVVPIRAAAEGLAVGGCEGAIVEYAVKMRQFDQGCLLERQLRAGQVPTCEMNLLAEQLARYHADAAQIEMSPGDATARSAEPAEENFEYLLKHLADSDQREPIRRLAAWSSQQAEVLADWFATRAASGAIRECHGDLHLNNVLRIEGRYLAFDPIEFNDRLSHIDSMNDVAFLMMELREHGYPTHSRRLINHYVESLDDYVGLRGLPFFLVYRAMVRAKVDLIRREQTHASRAESLSPDGWRYVEYAQHIVDRPAPALWITHGLSGSGKSTVALRLVDQFGLFRVRSDVIRKQLMGIAPLAKTPESRLSETYSSDITAQVYEQMGIRCEQVIAGGYGAIADATFLKRAQREAFAESARRLGVPLRIVDCSAPVAELERRLAARGPDPSDANLAVLRHQIDTAEPLTLEERSQVVSRSD